MQTLESSPNGASLQMPDSMASFAVALMSLNAHELRCLSDDNELMRHLKQTRQLMETRLQNVRATKQQVAAQSANDATNVHLQHQLAAGLRLDKLPMQHQQHDTSNQHHNGAATMPLNLDLSHNHMTQAQLQQQQQPINQLLMSPSAACYANYYGQQLAALAQPQVDRLQAQHQQHHHDQQQQQALFMAQQQHHQNHLLASQLQALLAASPEPNPNNCTPNGLTANNGFHHYQTTDLTSEQHQHQQQHQHQLVGHDAMMLAAQQHQREQELQLIKQYQQLQHHHHHHQQQHYHNHHNHQQQRQQLQLQLAQPALDLRTTPSRPLSGSSASVSPLGRATSTGSAKSTSSSAQITPKLATPTPTVPATAATTATTTTTTTSGKKYKGEFDEPTPAEVAQRERELDRPSHYHRQALERGECACVLGSQFRDKSSGDVLQMIEQWRASDVEQRTKWKWDVNDLPKDIPLSDIKKFEDLRREFSDGRADFGGASKRKPLGIRGTRQFLLILYCLWGHPGRDDPMQRDGYCPHCFAKIKKANEQSTLVRVVNHFNMKHRRGANPRLSPQLDGGASAATASAAACLLSLAASSQVCDLEERKQRPAVATSCDENLAQEMDLEPDVGCK